MHGRLIAREIQPNASFVMEHAHAISALAEPKGVLGRIGTMEVRLARSSAEIAAAQAVRFRVFYEELGARRAEIHALEQRDADRFDMICDHLLVIDTAIEGPENTQIVGTYRLLRQERALAGGGFYTSGEFNLDSLIRRHPTRNFLELGRSCVLPAYRQKRTVELLWQGIWTYCNHHKIDVMTGCASLPGTVPAAHAESLTFLAQNFMAQGAWRACALPAHYHTMDLMPAEAVNPKAALAALPPLVKGYLRLGAMIGDGCVIDPDFKTVDVLIILPVERIGERYLQHYAPKQ